MKKKKKKKMTIVCDVLIIDFCTLFRFRSLAQKYLEKDSAFAAMKKQEMDEQASQSWFGRVWNYVPGVGSGDLSLQLTDDILKELQSEIHDQEDKPFEVQDIPKDYVQTRVNFELETGSIELWDSHSQKSKIASASFHGYHISLEKRLDSMTFCGNLESMEVTDYYTKNSKFRQLISPSPITDVEEEDEDDSYFFSMMVDINPLDSIADYRLLLSMRPLNIILSKVFINKVISFFSKPITRIRRRKMEEFNVRAYTRLQEIRQQTEDQLMQAMTDRKIFDVQVHLSAPNLMIPKDFENKNTDTLVLVLGTLSISSDLRGKRNKKSLELGNGEEATEMDDIATMEGFEELVMASKSSIDDSGKDFSYLYDKYYLSLTSLEAGVTSRTIGITNLQFLPDENLIEKFDVNLYLEICNIESFELPKVIISGTLPSLRLNVSPEKTTSIMQILNTLNKRTSSTDEIEEIPSNIEEIEVEVESTNIIPTPEPQQAENEGVSVTQKAEKKQMQLNFSIPEAVILLSSNDQKIALMCLKGISASYLKRSFDVHVTLALHSMVVEDKLQPWGEDFKYLATSETYSLVQSSKFDDLISVSYVGISPDAPHYEHINHSVNFKFHKVHVTLNRETIITLVGCMKSIQNSLKKNVDDIPVEKKEIVHPEAEETEEDSISLQKRTLFSVSAEVNDISLTMNDTGVNIGVIQLKNSTFGLQLYKNTMRVEGKLGTMRIRDLDPGSSRYPEMFDTAELEDMITFSYETFQENQPNFPGYGVLLKIGINSINYMWIERFQLRVRQFFSEISEMQKILATTASSAAAVIKQKRLFCYQIHLSNPYIVIPLNVNSEKCLLIDLGQIAIEKQFPITKDGIQMTRIFVDVQKMNWKTGIYGSNDYLAILNNTDLQLWWEKPAEELVQEQHIYPGMNVWVYFPLLHITLTEHQSYQICDTIAQNICASQTAHEVFVQELKDNLEKNNLNISQESQKSNLADTLSILNNDISKLSDSIDEEPEEEEEEEEEFQFQPDEEK